MGPFSSGTASQKPASEDGSAAPVGTDAQLDRLIAAFEQMGDAVVITTCQLESPGPQIIATNPAFCAMTGYAREELLGKTPRILQGPKTDRGLLDKLRQACSSGDRFVGETVNYRKDGSEYVVEWSIDPVRNDAGSVICFVAVQRDVTARVLRDDAAKREAIKAAVDAGKHVAALTETVIVLEKTKRSFRSSDLGKLRERLVRLLRNDALKN